ncbi:hypothetical protein [Mycolicibacterium sp. A43C]
MLHIEKGKVVRARVDRATACFYESSRRVVLIADGGDFTAAQAALDELRTHIRGRS